MVQMPLDAAYPALRPRLTISGAVRAFPTFHRAFPLTRCRIPNLVQIGPRKGSHLFLFDVRNFVAGSVRVAGHACLLPQENKRFGDNPTVPSEGKLLTVSGTIRGPAEQTSGDHAVKRIPVEVVDFAFLGPDASPSSANAPRGMYLPTSLKRAF
jgi:hypothetical protein